MLSVLSRKLGFAMDRTGGDHRRRDPRVGKGLGYGSGEKREGGGDGLGEGDEKRGLFWMDKG